MTKRSALWILMVAVSVWAASLAPIPAGAQGLSSLLTSTEAEETPSDIDAVMSAAAENGVSVIVIDTNGRVLTDVDSAEAAEESQDMGGALMSMQDDAAAFRAALTEGLLTLPTSFNEVLFILRATSPD
ncbi:MAG: mechanosensitive ion channel family protein, partial [Pseudomonadota bacterium]